MEFNAMQYVMFRMEINTMNSHSEWNRAKKAQFRKSENTKNNVEKTLA